jgi:hypothetical protein
LHQSGKNPKRYEVHLSSKSGAIDVYLIQDPAAGCNQPVSPNDSLSSSPCLYNSLAIAELDPTETTLKHFEFPVEEPYDFDLRPLSDGAGDYYGFPSDVFNVFNMSTGA